MREPRVVPEPIWFGRGGPGPFAMAHLPTAPRRHGVVLCNTLGFEGLVAHRPLRHLADSLTASGFTVLRLDYRGTGDAAGEDHGPAGLDRVIEDIADAVHLLRDREGCTSISLVGIRCGAGFAARYALTDPDIDSLVLWAPFERGQSYCRELRAMARLTANARPPRSTPPARPEEVEAIGFIYPPRLLADLAGIDLLKDLTTAPAPDILVLERVDTAAVDGLVDTLAATGARVTHTTTDDWSDFMVSDETESVMPEDSLNQIAGWLEGRPEPGRTIIDRTDARPPASPPVPVLVGDGFRERSVWIDGHLFGIVTEPTGPMAPAGEPRRVMVLLNTGAINRTGPGRLHVHRSRAWAQAGITSVRIDLGGFGDSLAPDGEGENAPYSPSRVIEVARVVRWAHAELGAGHVTLFGICSGAFQSFHAALADVPVDQLILVNPIIFYLSADQCVEGTSGRAVMALHNLRRWRFVRSKLGAAWRDPAATWAYLRRVGQAGRLLSGARLRKAMRRAGVTTEDREPIVADIRHILARGVDLTFVFAAEEPGLGYLRHFAGEVLRGSDGSVAPRVIVIEGGDHVFSCPDARRDLVDLIEPLVGPGPTAATTTTTTDQPSARVAASAGRK